MTTKIFKAATFIIIAILLSSGIMYSQTKFWESTSGPNAGVSVMTITGNGDIWAGGQNGVCLSTDNGNTWSSFSFFTTSPSYVCFSIAVNPVNGYIFAGFGTGSSGTGTLYRSTNDGVNWEHVLYNTVYDILFTQSGEIYVRTVEEGVRYSTDMGNTWQNKNNGLPTTYMVQCLTQGTDGTLYAGVGRVYRSTNSGDEWLPLSSSSFPQGITNLTVPGDGSVLFATSPYSHYSGGTGGAMKSTDGGITWVQIHNGLTNNSSLSKLGTLSSIQKIVYNPVTQYIFLLAIDGIYRSTDLGAKWYKVSNGLATQDNHPLAPLQVIRALAVHPTTGTLFAGYPGAIPSIYRSIDNINSIISNVAPTSIDFGTVQAHLFKDSAVYITNTGETDMIIKDVFFTQEDLYSGPVSFVYLEMMMTMPRVPNDTVKPNETQRFPVFFIPYAGETLRLPYIPGTRTDTMVIVADVGVLAEIPFTGNAADIGTSSAEESDEIPTTYSLMQNYPNPFNPTTKIQYSLPEASNVKLSVYNSIGQEVMQLVNENQTVGRYIVDLNAQNLPSGVYFYRLQTGKFVETKKMLLIK